MDKIVSVFSDMRENADQRKLVFWLILFYVLYNMITVEYRPIYQMIILAMVRSMSKHMLNNSLAVT